MSFRKNLSPDQKMLLIVVGWVLVIGALCATLYALTPPAAPPTPVAPVTVNPGSNANAPGAPIEGAPRVFTAPGAQPPPDAPFADAPSAGKPAPQTFTAPGVGSGGPVGGPSSANGPGMPASGGPRLARNFETDGRPFAANAGQPPGGGALPLLPPPPGDARLGARPVRPSQLPPANSAAQSAFEAGSAALRAGNKSEAVADFARAVQLAPDNAPSRLNLASLYFDLNQPAKAVPHLRAVAASDPNNAAVQFNLARALLADKKLDAALPALRKTVQLAPDEREARAILARVLFERKQPKAAYDQWVTLAQKNPKDIEAQLQAAGIAGDVLKQPAQAEKWLRRAVAAAPNEPQPAILLGQVLLRKKDAQGAAAVLTKAAQARPDAFGVYPILADARSALGDNKGAAAALQSALSRLPQGKTDPQRAQIWATQNELRLALARTLAASQQWKAADAQFALYAKARPDDAGALLLWAQVAGELKNSKRQIEALRQAVRAAPQSAAAWTQLALAQRASGDKKGSLASFEKLNQLQPKNADVLFETARLQSELGQSAAAFDSWKGVIAARPQVVQAYPALLEAADQAGQNPDARQFLARELARQENPAALASIAQFYKSRNRASETRALLGDLMARAPKQRAARNALDALEKPSGAPQTAATVAPAAAPAPQNTPKIEVAAAPRNAPTSTPRTTPTINAPQSSATQSATSPIAAPILAKPRARASKSRIAPPKTAAPTPTNAPLLATPPTP